MMDIQKINQWVKKQPKLPVQKKTYFFTKSLMESNAYDFWVEARTFEEALEIAKKNCPVYGNWNCDFSVRYAEGYGDQCLSFTGDATKYDGPGETQVINLLDDKKYKADHHALGFELEEIKDD